MSSTIVVSLGTFIAILALLVFLRSRSTKLEIRPTDVVVAVLPVVIVLLVTGKIQKLELSESGVKIETAFVKASTSAITAQVTPLTGLPVEPIAMDEKRGIEEIPEMIAKRTEGLTFRLGYGRYYGPAIEEYVRRLTTQGFLKYLVIQNPDGTFFAMEDARQLVGLMSNQRGPFSWDQFANWLNRGDPAAFQQLPGLLTTEFAVGANDDKSRVLQTMEALNVDVLPVVSPQNRYAGIVNRSRLTASLILDVAQELKK